MPIKNILLITYTYPPEIGTGRLAYELCSELKDRKYNVIVLTSKPRTIYTLKDHPKSNSLNSHVHRVSIPFISRYLKNNLIYRGIEYFLLPISLFLKAFSLGSFDLIIAESPPLFIGFIAVLLKKIQSTTLIVKVGDIHPDALIKSGIIKNRIAISFLKKIEIITYKNADHIIVISIGYINYILPLINNCNKISVVNNWANISNIDHIINESTFINPLNMYEDKFTITYAGTISWPQDFNTIIQAMKYFNSNINYNDIILFIVGEGPKKKYISDLITTLKIDNIYFLSLQPQSVYFYILANSKACLVTLKKEYDSPSLPSKIWEIMACKTPIIACVPENSEVKKLIESSKCGLWVKPNDVEGMINAVKNLKNNNDVLKTLGKNGRKYLESNATLSSSVDKYENIFAIIDSKKLSKDN